MDISFVPPDLRRLDKIRHEALSAVLFDGEWPLRGALGLLDWRLGGRVSRLIQRGTVGGLRGESLLIPGESKVAFDKLFLRGGGAAGAFDGDAFDVILGEMLHTLTRAGVRSSALVLPGRALGLVTPADAMERFLAVVKTHPEHDEISLVEAPDAQREMEPVLLRARRAASVYED
ncbi:MAG: M17 family peptidase N-terminal domain-containing protein [Polyangiales bacterium]|nr:hypothetical protein [Myxococcales bacterium]MCB9658833.1 hypothetical protein [Sandaracinaceae bacterium]